MNPLIPMGAALIVGVIGYAAGRSDGRRLEAAEVLRTQAASSATKEEVLDRVAQAISTLQVVNRTIYQRAERETIREPVYTDCKHTPDGLRLVNEALTGYSGRPTDQGQLPRTNSP